MKALTVWQPWASLIVIDAKAPKFRRRIVAEQAEKLRNQFDKLGIDPGPVFADRAHGGD